MAKAKLKTKITATSPKDFVANVPNETRRKDAEVLLKLFEKITGWKPKMWGPTIVGYGSVTYTYETGHSGDICMVGFSPRGANMVLYSGIYPEDAGDLLKKLGKHKSSKACIYVNKLADVDMAALEKLLRAGLATRKKEAAEKGWPVKAT
jgi:hypothetical protein